MKAIQSTMLIFTFAMMTIVSFAQGPNQEKVTERPPSNSAMSKLYHNVTAKYNGYFNAQLKLDEGKKNLSGGYTDNYNLILDMYKFTAVPDAKSVAPDMDIAITKAAVDIKLHERSLFVDDCYLLIGQAQYVKRDYEAAEKTFGYIITTFDPKNPNNPMNKPVNAKEKKKQREKSAKQKKKERERERADKKKEREQIAAAKKKAREARKKGDKEATYEDFLPKNDKKKKKKDPDDKNYALKHRPIRKDAMIWVARTQIERGKYDEAQVWISRLKNDEKLFKSLKSELAEINAYYYLKQKKYEDAIAPLEDAIKLSKKRKDKARFAYIVAQIHQKAGRQQEAADAFERVIKFRPAYEMEFSARLNMIQNTLSEDAVAVAEAEKQLKKMLKDEKNEEYQDQIYFALGEIAFKANEDDKGISYLKKSVYFNFGNDATKSEAYLKLANTFYEKENYVDAKYYYDSTLTKIAKNDERYDIVELRSKSLTDIAKNIQIIEKQDSFLRIKKLIDDGKEKELLAIAQKIKDAEEKAKVTDKKAERPTGRRIAGRATSLQPTDAVGPSKTKVPKFWAYENNVEKGKREFQKAWGNGRKLSDDWRRSKRIGANGDIDIADAPTEEVFDLTKEEALALFKRIGVPMDEAAAQKADNNIMEAMASLGTLYRERLDNVQKSVDVLEQLIKRYPTTKYRLESLYALHIQHKQLNNQPEAEEYRKLILKEGRNSKFAKTIEDPNFLAGEKEKEVRLQEYYNSAYTDFKAGKFSAARNKLDGVEAKFGKDYSMKSKFALLGAMSTGGIDGKDAYIQSLKEVISKHKDTDEAKKAQEILDVLGGKTVASKPKTSGKAGKVTVDESGFTINDDGQHFVFVAYDSKKVKQTDALAAASDYNRKYHRLKRLRVSNFLVTIEIPTVLIRRFKNKEEALAYVLEIQKANEEFLGVKDPAFKPIAINQDNYKVILRDRGKWKTYIDFFDRVYLEGK